MNYKISSLAHMYTYIPANRGTLNRIHKASSRNKMLKKRIIVTLLVQKMFSN
jgi:hypothetical protein